MSEQTQTKPPLPTVGRIVHWVGREPDPLQVGRTRDTCCAAIVTSVPNGSYAAHLRVFSPQRIHPEFDVLGDFTDHRYGTWHWPERS